MGDNSDYEKPGCGVYILCVIVGSIISYFIYGLGTPIFIFTDEFGFKHLLFVLAEHVGGGIVIGLVIFVLVRVIVDTVHKFRK
ncbi:MAG: hypothetical protein LBF40_06205 [Deltaproteobacteria bacterium]|nr:hypothetical protein [Deltaproteobacteria bacterium]